MALNAGSFSARTQKARSSDACGRGAILQYQLLKIFFPRRRPEISRDEDETLESIRELISIANVGPGLLPNFFNGGWVEGADFLKH